MSKKADRLLERIQRMETKLEVLKCEYDMMLCREDHNGDLAAFAISMTNDRRRSDDETNIECHSQTFVLVPPSGGNNDTH